MDLASQVNRPNSKGETALMHGAASGSLKIVRMLVQVGAVFLFVVCGYGPRALNPGWWSKYSRRVHSRGHVVVRNYHIIIL